MSTKTGSFFKKFSFTVLVFALLFGGLGATARPAFAGADDSAACLEIHVVERGEYLSQIAKLYGVSWRWLAEINDLEEPSLIYPGQKLCVEVDEDATGEPTIPPTGNVASLSILSVVKGQSVTIQAANYPANLEFRVLMDKIGTRAVDGVRAGTAKTDKDGSFKATFGVPASLKDQNLIAIRIEVTGSSGHFAYNWFQNSTSTINPGSGTSAGRPSISIIKVIEDTSVEIEAKNLGANKMVIVWFDRMYGGGGVTGIKAGTLIAGSDGSLKATVRIPKELHDRSALAIRLQAVDGSGSSVSNWFSNASSENGVGSGAPYGYTGGIPSISIASVLEDDEVSIEARQFPARKELNVFMGKMGTQGLNGIKVGMVKTEKDGSVSESFNIPKELRGKEKIAVRLQAADGSGYYAYNWFFNQDTN